MTFKTFIGFCGFTTYVEVEYENKTIRRRADELFKAENEFDNINIILFNINQMKSNTINVVLEEQSKPQLSY